MTREEMWEEFENQLKREVRTPITLSYDDGIRLAELGIKEAVAKWKPRLEQEQKKGYWITTPREAQTFDWIDFGDEEKTYYITCSECDYQFTSTSKMTDFRFCPNCGADMRGVR